MKILVQIFIILSFCSCATYDPKTGTYTEDSTPMESNINPGPVVGALAAVAGLIEISQYSPNSTKNIGVSGVCEIQSKTVKEKQNLPKKCKDTYLRVTGVHSHKVMTIWVDTDGAFKFNAKAGEIFNVEAVNDTTGMHSNIIRVKSPSKLKINIF